MSGGERNGGAPLDRQGPSELAGGDTNGAGPRVLVVGGRGLEDDAAVHAELNLLHAGLGEVREVLADDTHAGDAAMRWAVEHRVPHRRARASDLAPTHGTIVLAFPDGVVLQMQRAGWDVREVRVA